MGELNMCSHVYKTADGPEQQATRTTVWVRGHFSNMLWAATTRTRSTQSVEPHALEGVVTLDAVWVEVHNSITIIYAACNARTCIAR